LFGLLLVCVIPMERAVVALSYPFQLDREEGYVLGQALAINRGESVLPIQSTSRRTSSATTRRCIPR
jgi:hypothetical protein